jgi:hypothetical protein
MLPHWFITCGNWLPATSGALAHGMSCTKNASSPYRHVHRHRNPLIKTFSHGGGAPILDVGSASAALCL